MENDRIASRGRQTDRLGGGEREKERKERPGT